MITRLQTTRRSPYYEMQPTHHLKRLCRTATFGVRFLVTDYGTQTEPLARGSRLPQHYRKDIVRVPHCKALYRWMTRNEGLSAPAFSRLALAESATPYCTSGSSSTAVSRIQHKCVLVIVRYIGPAERSSVVAMWSLFSFPAVLLELSSGNLQSNAMVTGCLEHGGIQCDRIQLPAKPVLKSLFDAWRQRSVSVGGSVGVMSNMRPAWCRAHARQPLLLILSGLHSTDSK